jgi:hypothetical protein
LQHALDSRSSRAEVQRFLGGAPAALAPVLKGRKTPISRKSKRGGVDRSSDSWTSKPPGRASDLKREA